jgi:type I site-specific restriction endonuclease
MTLKTNQENMPAIFRFGLTFLCDGHVIKKFYGLLDEYNNMNEAETRAELIDPKLKACGWGVTEGSKILREYNITAVRIQIGGRGKCEIADYVLVYKGIKLAIVEAKSDELPVGEGVLQAKEYAQKLQLETTSWQSTNKREHFFYHFPNLYERNGCRR